MRIALVNAPLKSAVCDHGVGHQLPLGLLRIGGPLLDAGFAVKLIDAAREHLPDRETAARVLAFGADVVMVAHVGSTAAHPFALRVLRAVKAALPRAVTVYGGVHPTYHDREILAAHPEVDLIVRGEGEAAALELVRVLDRRPSEAGGPAVGGLPALGEVAGVSWRGDGRVVRNAARAPIEDLDGFRTAWELVDDWDRYRAFGLGRAAVVQFSRGCPHRCSYCGQWMFWRRWRHRDVGLFVDELEWLHRECGVDFFWLADENPTTDRAVWASVLREIVRRRLAIGLCGSMRAQDIVRDADLLPLYKRAGFVYILLGVETVTDENLAKIRKGSSVDEAYRAIRLLRRHGILTVVDYIFGIEEETSGTIWRGLRGLWRYDGDFVNALYLTPHAWTPLGRALRAARPVEPDLAKWDYRHQVVGLDRLSPAQLFLGVKLVELLYHLHPRRLWRILTAPDPDVRRQLRFGFRHTTAVYFHEVLEFLAAQWGARGSPMTGSPADAQSVEGERTLAERRL